MKISVKPKAKAIADGDVKEVHIGKAENGGADVHTLSAGSKKDPFPTRKHTGSFSTIQEVLAHAGEHLGVPAGTTNSEPAGNEITEQPAGPMKTKKPYTPPASPA